MPVAKLPDPEEVFVARLAAQSSVTAITPRIGTRWSGTYPAVRVTLVGDFGSDIEGRRDVVFQVECVADSDSVASDLARTIESCRLDMRGTGAGGWLALTDVSSIIPGFDEVSERPRYDLTMQGTVGVS